MRLFLVTLVMLEIEPIVYAQVVQENLWVTNGQVFSVAKEGNTVYVGGTFTTVGPATGGGTGLDMTTGTTDGSFPRVDGTVRVVTSDGAGGWFIGGVFTAVANEPRSNIAHIKPDKTVDLSWDPNALGGEVLAIAVNGATVYAGGAFNAIGGQPRNRIAALDAATGLADAWDPNAASVVRGLVVTGSTVYVYGDFNNIGGQPRTFLAALDASTGLATAWNPAPVPNVTSFAISASTLYVGGNFSTIGGQGRNRIAAVDLTTGLVTPWNPNSNGQVSGIAVSGSIVYVGGAFTTVGGQTRNRIAALDATTGLATTWNPNATGSGINTIAISGSNVYAGGTFSNIGGQQRNHIAALDATTGLATSWDPNPGTAAVVLSLATSGSTIYAGGIFHTMGGQPRRNIASINALTGIVTGWDPMIATGSTVRSILVNGTTVYVGGTFTGIGAQPRNNIAAIDATTGIATSWNPDASSQIITLALSGTNILAGGAFTIIGGQARNRIAALDAITGLATSWNPSANNLVRVIVSDGSAIYAGGFFTNIGGQGRNGLAALDAITGLATSWNPNPNFLPVNDMAVSASTVYVGGAFNNIGGQTRLSIAALDPVTGLATAWNPNHTPADVQTLAIAGSTVYVGGGFPIEAFDISTGLLSAAQPVQNGLVQDMVTSGLGVIAGGTFNQVGGKSIQGIVGLSAPSGSYTPTIVSFTPGSGANGMHVTISGTNFHPTITENIVKVNGTTAVVGTSSNTSITTSVPPGSSSGLITVTVNGITGTSSTPFTVVNTVGSYPPCIFGSRVDISAGNRPWGSALGDLNGDGKPDLVIANNFGNNISIFQNTSATGSISSSSFAAPVNFGGVFNPINVKIRDLDGDGKLDVAVVSNTSNAVCMFHNISTGGTINASSFEPIVCLGVGQNPVDVAIGDLDGDGKPDLAVTNINSLFLSTFRNQSTVGTLNAGSFAPRFDFSMPTGYTTIFATDIDADGKPDLITRLASSIAVLRNTGTAGVINSGTFAPRVDIPGGSTSISDFLVGDLDGDAKQDLIFTHGGSNTISVRRNISSPGSITTASLEPTVFFPARPSNQSPRLSDLDGDGKPDLLVVDGNTKTLSIFRNVSTSGVINGSSLELRADYIVGADPLQIAIGDIDGDGAPEAIVNNNDDNTFSIFRNVATSSSAVTISSFAPTSGPAGTPVVISGTNFDPIFSSNAVNFNGVYATVTASTTTSITTSVPPGATDGAIQVIANCHSTSLATFTVGSGGSIVILPQTTSTAVCNGSTASFMIGASGTTNITYQWQKFDGSVFNNIANGGGYSGTTTTILAVNTTGNFGAGDYRCKVSGDFSPDAFSSLATLTVNPIPSVPTSPISASSCGPGSVLLLVSGASNGDYRWYTTPSGGTAIVGEVNSSYPTPSLSVTTTYYAAISINSCESVTRTPVVATINTLPSSPDAVPNSNCGPGVVSLGATGATNGQYRWYAALTGGIPIAAEVNSTFSTPGLASTTSYFATINVAGCESAPRTEVIATINPIPGDPTVPVPDGPFCSGSTFTFSTSGASAGEYRWNTLVSGGTPIANETNATYSLLLTSASNATYYASIVINGCESGRQPATASVLPLPVEPTVVGNLGCAPSASLELSALGGSPGEYRWYTAATGGSPIVGQTNSTYMTPVLSATTLFYVSIDNSICESPRVPVDAQIRDCTPIIAAISKTTPIGSFVDIDIAILVTVISDPIDLASIKVIAQPISGATATVSAGVLEVNYAGVSFAGTDRLTIEACDLAAHCAQREFTIEVVGDITVYNAVSPNGDGKNDTFTVQYIESLPETQKNKLTIFNRWGTVVYEALDYNNSSNVFKGQSNSGDELAPGTYFYTIEFSSGAPKRTGFISLRR